MLQTFAIGSILLAVALTFSALVGLAAAKLYWWLSSRAERR